MMQVVLAHGAESDRKLNIPGEVSYCTRGFGGGGLSAGTSALQLLCVSSRQLSTAWNSMSAPCEFHVMCAAFAPLPA
jgi:hypothetical protein